MEDGKEEKVESFVFLNWGWRGIVPLTAVSLIWILLVHPAIVSQLFAKWFSAFLCVYVRLCGFLLYWLEIGCSLLHLDSYHFGN